jgi:uncharacterized protein (DUF58 family)
MRPRRPLLIAVTGWTGLGLAAAWWPAAAAAWLAVGVVLGGAALADLVLLLAIRSPLAERRVGHVLPQGVWSDVMLGLLNPHRHRVRLDCHDLHPSGFDVQGQPRRIVLPPRSRVWVRYRLRSPARGRFAFDGCDLALYSPFGLWRRRRRLWLPQPVRVYPNFAEISHYTLMAANDQLALLGIRRRPRRGVGAELHQLRDYRRGDTLRQIDWKATSRMRRLIAREYEDERDQRVLFLLDCGRRMRHLDASGRGHLDQALNALLLLAYVAVHQGDAVGLMTYGGPRRWLAPRKEAGTVRRLLEAVYDLQPSLAAADPLAAARELTQRQPRRALVVIATNSRDDDHPELFDAVKVLSRRHLVVVADLREASLDDAITAPIEGRSRALRFHAVHGYLDDRRRHHQRLRHLGVPVLDLLPRQLPIALVNQYFSLKRAGSL